MVESVASKLEKSRQSLLDLSTRNRLLSLPKRASGKLLNIYDELTSEAYKRLVSESKSMTFLPGRMVEQDPSEVAFFTGEARGIDVRGCPYPQNSFTRLPAKNLKNRFGSK